MNNLIFTQYNIEQKSDEWFKKRLGVLTASRLSRVINVKGEITNTKQIAEELANEIITGNINKITTNAMERGSNLESEARNEFEKATNMKVVETGIFIANDNSCGGSPDGLINDDGIIEIKCCLEKKHLENIKDIKNNKCPDSYKAQIQGNLYFTNREYCYFIAYNPDIKENQFAYCKIYKDNNYITKIKNAILQVEKQKQQILQLEKQQKINNIQQFNWAF